MKEDKIMPCPANRFLPQALFNKLFEKAVDSFVADSKDQSRFPVSVFPDNQSLSPDLIVPTVESIISNSIIDWNADDAVPQTVTAMYRLKGVLSRTFLTMIDHPGEESSEKGFSLLSDDLSRFFPDKTILESPQLKEWFCRFIIAGYLHPGINTRAQVDKGLIPNETKRYREIYERQMDVFKKTLSELSVEDLSLYIRFADLKLQWAESSSNQKDRRRLNSSPMKTADLILIEKAFKKVSKDETAMIGNFFQEDENVWGRIKTGWKWQQVQEALFLLPTLKAFKTATHVLAALDDNLIVLSAKNHLADYGGEFESDPHWNIRAVSVSALLRHNWNSAGGWIKDYPNLVKTLETNLEFSGFSVPRKYLPSIAIEFLTQLGQTEKPEVFLEVLSKIHTFVENDSKATAGWLTALLVLKSGNNQAKDFFEKTIGEWTAVPSPAREVLLNQKSGRIWLTKEGKIRLTDSRTNLASAFMIYSCDLPVEAETAAPTIIADLTRKEEVKIRPNELAKVPLFGEVGIVADETALDLIGKVMIGGKQLEGDGLFDEHSKKFVPRWRELFNSSTLNQEILYPLRANRSDDLLRQAFEFGIDGVYIKGNDVVYILKKEITGDQNNHSVQLGIRGKLNENGQLAIKGMDESFIGEPENLLLANIAIHCATKEPRCTLALSAKRDREIQSFIRSGVADWNRVQRGNLPKISADGENCNVAIQAPNFTEVILVAEAKK